MHTFDQRLENPACTTSDGTIYLLYVSTQWNVLPEHSLDVDDGLGVCHVVLLSAHGALLVHNHQVVCVDYTTLEQVV